MSPNVGRRSQSPLDTFTPVCLAFKALLKWHLLQPLLIHPCFHAEVVSCLLSHDPLVYNTTKRLDSLSDMLEAQH